jgi:alkanesulfonate monooxygenase SsuD/methylene tetrahydromethanopterin reductase-like flavin-dependent oxidoreductase (luciferase family)
MRFSVWPSPSQGWLSILDLATYAERSGWDGLWMSDHLMPDEGSALESPIDECLVTVAALAGCISRIRLGTLVLCNSFRHPAVVAKMAAGIDQISAGRFVLGLGAGWQSNEHLAYGFGFPGAGERLERLEESCRVIRGLLTQEATTVDGRFYSLSDARAFPKPVQDRLPILIGGGGEKVLLRLVASLADEWNNWSTPEEMVRKRAVLGQHCDAIDRDVNDIVVSTQALLFLSEDTEKLKGPRERLTSGAPGPPMIVGGPDEVREIVGRYRDAGVDELIVPDFTLGVGSARQDIYELFMTEVVHEFRSDSGTTT